MRIICHIGGPKTGTTSLQKTLYSNIEQLNANSIYLDKEVLGFPNNRKLAAYFEPTNSNYFLRRNLMSQSDILTHFYGFEESARALFEQTSGTFNYFLITSEHLSSRLTELSQVRKLARILASAGNEVEIHMYFREQASLLESTWLEALKGGRISVSLQGFARQNRQPARFNYEVISDLWAGVFGAENFFAHLYFPNPTFSIVDDFRNRVLGEAFVGDIETKDKRENVRLSAPKANLLRVSNMLLQSLRNRRLQERYRRRVLRGITDFPLQLGAPARLDIETRKSIHLAYKQSNAVFFSKFRPGGIADFEGIFPEWAGLR